MAIVAAIGKVIVPYTQARRCGTLPSNCHIRSDTYSHWFAFYELPTKMAGDFIFKGGPNQLVN